MVFLTKEEEAKVVDSIKFAEKGTSAEVKVHIDRKCAKNPLEKGVEWFLKLKMEKTELRNGVLIYIAYEDRKIAIIGDKGINEKVDDNFWNDTYINMAKLLSQGKSCEALCLGVKSVGEKLAQFFPYQTDDVNELSDDISYGK